MMKAISVVSTFTNKISLVQGKEYAIIGVEERGPNKIFLRVIDESGEPNLYPSDYFAEDVYTSPPNWSVKKFEDWINIYPPELSGSCFFDHLSEDKPEQVKIFYDFLQKHQSFLRGLNKG